jgi:hypothetical protein
MEERCPLDLHYFVDRVTEQEPSIQRVDTGFFDRLQNTVEAAQVQRCFLLSGATVSSPEDRGFQPLAGRVEKSGSESFERKLGSQHAEELRSG